MDSVQGSCTELCCMKLIRQVLTAEALSGEKGGGDVCMSPV